MIMKNFYLLNLITHFRTNIPSLRWYFPTRNNFKLNLPSSEKKINTENNTRTP